MKLPAFLRSRIPARALIAVAALSLAAWVADACNVLAPVNAALMDATIRLNRWRMPPQPTTTDPIIVGLDDAYIAATPEPQALSHFMLARFLDAMVAADAHAIGLQMPLPERAITTVRRIDRPNVNLHKTLTAALGRAAPQTPVIVAKAWDERAERFLAVHPTM